MTMILSTYRIRLTLLFTICLAVPLLLLTKVFYEEHKKKLYDVVEWSLLRDAKAAAERSPDPKDLADDEELFRRTDMTSVQMRRHGGVLVLGSPSSVTQRWPVNIEKLKVALDGAVQFDQVISKGELFSVIYFPLERDVVLRIGRSLEDVTRYNASLQRYTMLYPAIAVICSFLMGLLLATVAVAPIIQIREQARQIMQRKSAEAIPSTKWGSEIEGLVEVVNTMLAEIHDSLQMHKRFTSDLSHEIRSPLTSLIGNTEVALRKRRSAEEYENVLRDNMTELIRLSRITDNMLFLSRADSHILELRQQRFDVSLLLRNLLDRFRGKADKAGVMLHAELNMSLLVCGDIDLLEQAFSNLIDNGIKYSQRGGAVAVRGERDGVDVKVTVTDTGIGIPDEELPHIFNRFYRVQRGHEMWVAGTGLGLSITKWIVVANGGTITVKSQLGKGSSFIVVLHEEC